MLGLTVLSSPAYDDPKWDNLRDRTRQHISKIDTLIEQKEGDSVKNE